MYKAVIFDLDGTLIDSLPDLMDSVNQALSSLGYQTHTYEEVRSFVGNGVRKLIERSLPASATSADVDRCLELFKCVYASRKLNKTAPFDGVLPLLGSLKDKGVVVGVLSNKYDVAVKEIIASLFPSLIDERFAWGESSVVPKKPNPEGLLSMMKEMGVSPAECCYVGDSDVDIRTGNAAGVHAIGVLWGYRDSDCLQKEGPHCLVSTPGELLNEILESHV